MNISEIIRLNLNECSLLLLLMKQEKLKYPNANNPFHEKLIEKLTKLEKKMTKDMP